MDFPIVMENRWKSPVFNGKTHHFTIFYPLKVVDLSTHPFRHPGNHLALRFEIRRRLVGGDFLKSKIRKERAQGGATLGTSRPCAMFWIWKYTHTIYIYILYIYILYIYIYCIYIYCIYIYCIYIYIWMTYMKWSKNDPSQNGPFWHSVCWEFGSPQFQVPFGARHRGQNDVGLQGRKPPAKKPAVPLAPPKLRP